MGIGNWQFLVSPLASLVWMVCTGNCWSLIDNLQLHKLTDGGATSLAAAGVPPATQIQAIGLHLCSTSATFNCGHPTLFASL